MGLAPSAYPDDRSVGTIDWCRSVPAAAVALRRGEVHLVRGRVGQTLTMSDGRTYRVFRETVKEPVDDPSRPAVLLARFHLRGMGPRRRLLHALFRRLCIVTTPFFVGLGGFGSKLWMVDPATGDFAGLYDWRGVHDARAYAEGLMRVLRPLSARGSVSYELVPDTTVDSYLAAHRPGVAAPADRPDRALSSVG